MLIEYSCRRKQIQTYMCNVRIRTDAPEREFLDLQVDGACGIKWLSSMPQTTDEEFRQAFLHRNVLRILLTPSCCSQCLPDQQGRRLWASLSRLYVDRTLLPSGRTSIRPCSPMRFAVVSSASSATSHIARSGSISA